jgi:Trk K+ transport system NAD-binding subunit
MASASTDQHVVVLSPGVKFLSAQIASLRSDPRQRQNLASLNKFLITLALVIVAFAVIFHMIMVYEGQKHSWLTGFYWALTVMSTLGFGDITFTSDVGRLFSIIVLLTGIMMLLVVLPFAFIRLFYAPWMEAQLKLRAPRRVPEGTTGHVIICKYDSVAKELMRRLSAIHVPYFLLEADSATAAGLDADGVAVIAGNPESTDTWSGLSLETARAVLANDNDPHNTNITLTVREKSDDIMIIATAENEASIDLLELAGATQVIPLKKRLGAQLANRVNAGHAEAHVIGEFEELLIAEFPVHRTPLANKTVRETKLREVLGISIVGVWERGAFSTARGDRKLTESSVPVVIGTPEQIQSLNELLVIYDANPNPTLVLGGGAVGCAAASALKQRDIPVHVVEKQQAVADRLMEITGADRVVVGDAADLDAILGAGLKEAPSVLLTTNDDSINIYLAVYCRRLNPELRIVSRITNEDNLEAIHRAGTDFVLSDASLGAEAVLSYLEHREMTMLGAGIEIFHMPVPKVLEGKTLVACEIGSKTGLNVIAIRDGDKLVGNPGASTRLPRGGEVLLVGTTDQRSRFVEEFANGASKKKVRRKQAVQSA